MRTQKNQSRFIEMFGNGNWEQRPLGDVGTFKRGGGFQKSDYVEHGIPCIHYGQIHTVFGPFIYSHISEISSDLESKTKFASKGDLIIAITSEDAEGSCKSTAWLGAYPVAVGAHAAIYNHCMNPLYMSFFFKSALFNHAKMEYIHGTKVVEIRPDDIAKILVPCPPRSLQEQFSTIAEQADKSKFTDFKSRFIEMFGDTLKNTKDWEFRRLPEVTTIVLGSTPSSSNPDYWDGSVKWITPAELDDNSFILTDSERHITVDGVRNAGLKSFPAGTVIFSTRAPIGKTAIAGCEMYCNQGFKNFICSKKLNPIYLFYTLRSHKEELQKMGTGSTFLELSKKTIENISVSVPERSLQDEFEVVYRQADKSKYLS